MDYTKGGQGPYAKLTHLSEDPFSSLASTESLVYHTAEEIYDIPPKFLGTFIFPESLQGFFFHFFRWHIYKVMAHLFLFQTLYSLSIGCDAVPDWVSQLLGFIAIIPSIVMAFFLLNVSIMSRLVNYFMFWWMVGNFILNVICWQILTPVAPSALPFLFARCIVFVTALGFTDAIHPSVRVTVTKLGWIYFSLWYFGWAIVLQFGLWETEIHNEVPIVNLNGNVVYSVYSMCLSSTWNLFLFSFRYVYSIFSKPNAFALWRSPIFSTTQFEVPFIRQSRRKTALPITFENTEKASMHIRAIPIWSNVQHEVIYFGSYFLPMTWVLAMRDFLLRKTFFMFGWCLTFGVLAVIGDETLIGDIAKWTLYNIAIAVPCIPLWVTLNVTIVKQLMGYAGMWWMIFNYILTSVAVVLYLNETPYSWSTYIAVLSLRILAVIIWLPCYGLTDAFPEEFRKSTNTFLFFCMAVFWIYWLVTYLMDFGTHLRKDLSISFRNIAIVDSVVDLDTTCIFNICVWSLRFMAYSYFWPDTFLILTSRINCEMPSRRYSVHIDSSAALKTSHRNGSISRASGVYGSHCRLMDLIGEVSNADNLPNLLKHTI